METVIVEISIPGTDEKYDFKLPSTAKIKNVTEELSRILKITKGNIEFDPELLLLCDLEKGKVLNPNKTVAEHQITDGATLQLI